MNEAQTQFVDKLVDTIRTTLEYRFNNPGRFTGKVVLVLAVNPKEIQDELVKELFDTVDRKEFVIKVQEHHFDTTADFSKYEPAYTVPELTAKQGT